MATQVAQKFYDLLRKHFETGVPWQNMNFTDDQKRRIEVCLDAYKRFEADPFMDLSLYIKNKWGRSYSELKNDLKVVEYISSFYAQGQRNISTMKVRHAANIMMRNGADTGNMKAVNDGATLLFKLDRLDQPETPEELGDELIRMPLVVTSDVKKKFPTKTSHETEEMKKIRKTWGVKIDQWQDMIENDEGVYIPDVDENSLQMEDNTDTERESGQDRFTQLEEEE
nr:MAG TPA_asm: hypothetical protein [Caudoviricetes sp.]